MTPLKRLREAKLKKPEEIDTVRKNLASALRIRGWGHRHFRRLLGKQWEHLSDELLTAYCAYSEDARWRESIPYAFIMDAAVQLDCTGGFEELMSMDFSRKSLGIRYDGRTSDSQALAARYAEHEAIERRKDDGEIIVYSSSPAHVLLTSRLLDQVLRDQRNARNSRGDGELLKFQKSTYVQSTKDYNDNGKGRARFVNLVPSQFFFRIIDRRGAFEGLEVGDVVKFLDRLQEDCILRRRTSVGLVVEQEVPKNLRVRMSTDRSFMTLGEHLTLTATSMLPLTLIDSRERSTIDEAHRDLKSFRRACGPNFFSEQDKPALTKAFDGFRRRAEQSAINRKKTTAA